MPFFMDASILNLLPPESSLPATYWNNLSQNDKAEFLKLRNQLHQSQKTSVKDRRLVSFSNEMTTILQFLEQSETGRECRCILAGVAFAGPFICVNTRQLKNFLGRCKSSINGSFQQLGYVAVRTKSKAKSCVLSVIPSLASDPNLLRQWTVRCASDDAHYCFVSKFQPNPMPTITPEDLNEERKPQLLASISNDLSNAQQNNDDSSITNNSYLPPRSLSAINQSTAMLIKQQTQQKQKQQKHQNQNRHQNYQNNIMNQSSNSQPIIRRDYDFDLSNFNDFRYQEKIPEMTPSYSFDFLQTLTHNNNDNWSDLSNIYQGEISVDDEWDPIIQKTMSRSQSALFAQENSSTIIDFPLYLDF